MRLLRYGVVLILAVGMVQSVAAQSVLSRYTFDDGPASGTSYSDGDVITDDGPNDHHLTVVGSGLSWTSDGQVGGAVQFDGVDGFLEDADAENYLNGLDALTVVVWVKSNVTGVNNGILTSELPDDDDQNWSLRYDADGSFGDGTNVIKGGIDTEGGKQEYESASDVQTTDWQFLALIYEDGEPLKLYVDGNFSNSTYNPQSASGLTTGAETLRIGQGAKQVDDLWNGAIDDIRIYGAALSEDDLDQIYDDTLPVELSRFEVTADGRDAHLKWTTSSEANNAGFHVEHRAPKAMQWSRGAFVDGAGTTTQPETYQVQQERLAPGTHQFRLVQVDVDGATHVHGPQSVSIRPKAGFAMQVGPTPAQSEAVVTLRSPNSGSVTVELYNLLGERVRVLHQGSLRANGRHRISVPTTMLSPGTYFVRAVSAQGTHTKKLTVMR